VTVAGARSLADRLFWAICKEIRPDQTSTGGMVHEASESPRRDARDRQPYFCNYWSSNRLTDSWAVSSTLSNHAANIGNVRKTSGPPVRRSPTMHCDSDGKVDSLSRRGEPVKSVLELHFIGKGKKELVTTIAAFLVRRYQENSTATLHTLRRYACRHRSA